MGGSGVGEDLSGALDGGEEVIRVLLAGRYRSRMVNTDLSATPFNSIASNTP
jgi:hypothetical protein